MTSPYARALSTTTPQVEQADPRQVKNSAGGYTFTGSDKTRLDRFLILGTDGGTYYTSEKALTKQNIDFLVDLIKRDPSLYIDRVRDVSYSGRAPRNSAAIFALAVAFKHGDKDAKNFARTMAFPSVVRTSTHLFEFVQYLELLGGWNRTKRDTVASWYTSKSTDALAYQAVKYRQRNGWTHRDILRLSHPKGIDTNVGNFILGKQTEPSTIPIIHGFEWAQKAATIGDLLAVLDQNPNLPWETIPTQFLKNVDVWKKLFYSGQLSGQALVRNITRLARIGAFNDIVFAADYAEKLTDEQMIARTRLHPIQYLNASVVHLSGHRVNRLGSYATRTKDWQTNSIIRNALNDGFHLAFKHMEPANKRTFISLDVSGSMWWDSSTCTGLDISAATAAACMAMVTARTEPYYTVNAFAQAMKNINITPQMDINSIDQAMQLVMGGGTDCSLPMLYAIKNKIEVDTFAVYTDNETWYGLIHPHEALQKYRQAMGIDAKLVVVGVSATEFSIADPTDIGMMDVVGFDASAPRVIADFSAGRI